MLEPSVTPRQSCAWLSSSWAWFGSSKTPFVIVAILFSSPIILKAFAVLAYQRFCLGAPPDFSLSIVLQWQRLFMPLFLIAFGCLIFVLEGAQSSVMLANKQSLETLGIVLRGIDLSKSKRDRAEKALSAIVGGVPIDTFFIGRQLLMVAFTFMFKLCYDAAQFTSMEQQQLAQAQASCPRAYATLVDVYGVLDNWFVATVLCAILVAYFSQVPSKLMAQHHPLRFFSSIPGTIFAPSVSRLMGKISLLWYPISALRLRAIERQREEKFSYYAGRELIPLSTEDVFDALAHLYGEYIREISIILTQQSAEEPNVWFVQDNSVYQIVRPSRDFSQTIQVPEMLRFKYEVFSESPDGQKRLPYQTKSLSYQITPVEGGTKEVLARVNARFESDQPAGADVRWEMSYLTPVITKEDSFRMSSRVFEIHIKKPVKKVTFSVASLPCEDPEVEIHPVDGAESPMYKNKEKLASSTEKGVVVHYPSIGSKLVFLF
jgi:hypothetical protein